MAISAEEVLAEIGPVQEILDAHDGVVTVLDTSDGNIMLSLDGGCTGCSSTPMTAMQIYYSLKKLDNIINIFNKESCTSRIFLLSNNSEFSSPISRPSLL